jgi:hypothetical protein
VSASYSGFYRNASQVFKMMQFCWTLDNIDYVLQKRHPMEIESMRRKNPGLMGIPVCYAMIDGEPEWFPQTLQGWPKVFLFSPL